MPQALVIQAGVLLPICAPPIEDAAVRIRHGHIEAVGPAAVLRPVPGDRVIRLPDCVLMPGLVNAHCHLELGAVSGQVPFTGSFAEWLLRVVRQRPTDAEQVVRAVSRGTRALLLGGCTAVGDITSSGLALAPLAGSGVRAVLFRELIGLVPERAEASLGLARAWLEATPPRGLVRPGLSPHAPYSTAASVYQGAAALANDANAPVTTHLSEPPEEAELLARGSGPLAALLEALGIPHARWPQCDVSPVRYLSDLGFLALRGAAAHVGHLLPGDLDLLAAGRMVPVYCPRSHRFFGRPRHPAAEMLRAGVPVALGTDSLASNDRLDMLAEARAAWEDHPNTTAEDWVRAATAAGARALGLEGICGILHPGLAADVIAIAPRGHAANPYAAVLSPGSAVRLVLVSGREPT